MAQTELTFPMPPLSGSVVGLSIADRYDDLRVPLLQTRIGGTAPTVGKLRDDGAGSTGVYSFAFSNSAVDEVLFETQMPHDWEPGTTIYWHVHWTAGNNSVAQAGKVVRWKLEYTKSDNNANTIPLTQFLVAEDTITGTAYAGEITADIPLTMVGCDSSCVLICRFFRDNTVANNAPVSIFAMSTDFHYLRSRIGTINHEYPFGGG